jgi:outer membrane protein OmpU
MKNLALGCTALVTVTTLFAGAAQSAEKIKLNVGGYLQTSFVAADYSSGNRLPTNLRNEGEIHFTGSTVLDNGLKFGVNIQLEARESTDQVDETYIFVEGAFGRVNLGSENGASYLMHYASPSPVIGWGLNDPNFEAGGFTTLATSPNEVSDADKITYFTPRFSGIQLGVSFTPDGDSETGAVARPTSPIGVEGPEDEAYSVGINYISTISDINIKASLGYDLITRSFSGATALDDTDEIATGLALGYNGFEVGGAYKYTDNDSGTNGSERHDANFGITYGQGPWKLGAQYARVELDGTSNGELDAFLIGGQYDLGPGITALGGVQYFSGDGALIGTAGDEATVFFVGTALYF